MINSYLDYIIDPFCDGIFIRISVLCHTATAPIMSLFTSDLSFCADPFNNFVLR